MGFAPHDAEDVRSGMPTSGIRITSPRSTATGAAALPPRSSPTGSALIARMRPIGVPLGIAVLLAVPGSPRSAGATGDACEHASYIIAGLAPVAGSIALALIGRRSGARDARAANAVGVEVRP